MSQSELEKQIYAQADELAQLLSQLHGPARNVARRAVVESIREATAEQPAAETPEGEAGTRGNFGAFGLMVMVVGLMFVPIMPVMAAFLFAMGVAILVLSFVAARFARR